MTLRNVIIEIIGTPILEIDDDVISDLLGSSSEYKKEFRKWGCEHFGIVKKAICMQSERFGTNKLNYLYGLKVNYDVINDEQLIQGLIGFIGMAVTICLGFWSGSDRVGYKVPLVLVFALFLFVFIRWIVLIVTAKYSYKNRFYKQVVDVLIEENNKENCHITEKKSINEDKG